VLNGDRKSAAHARGNLSEGGIHGYIRPRTRQPQQLGDRHSVVADDSKALRTGLVAEQNLPAPDTSSSYVTCGLRRYSRYRPV